jgi:hypothetical protein
MELVIVNKKTGEVVSSFDVTNKSERELNRCQMGMSINLNHKKYKIELRILKVKTQVNTEGSQS